MKTADDITAIKVHLEGMSKDIKYICKDMKAIHKALYGNGKAGAIDRIETLEKFRIKFVGIVIGLSLAGQGLATIILKAVF